MRRFLIAVLLSAAAASPALAQDGNDHRDQQNKGHAQAQQQRGPGHADRGNDNNHQQAPQFVRQQQGPMQQQAYGNRGYRGGFQGPRQQPEAVRNWNGQRGGWGGQRFEGRGNPAAPGQVQVQQQAYGNRGYRGAFQGPRQQPEPVRNWNGQRGHWNGEGGDYRQRVAGQQQRYGEANRWAGNGWNRDWRNDRRYDWRDYRNEHRSIFRLGIYYDPFGYGYQQFNIGFRLAPVYFGERYWIDPAMYELPYPPPGTQWIRYWNDAVLVDIYSGEVVDVIHGFFW